MNISVVIPAYNEATTLSAVLSDVLRYCKKIIVVDDGSTDATSCVAKSFPVTLLSHACNVGQGAALRTGTRYAVMTGADVIVHFDADGQLSGKDIPEMVHPVCIDEVDITLGSRFLSDNAIPVSRKWVLQAGRIFTYYYSHLSLTDPQNGFRAMNREAAQKIAIAQNRMAHGSEILHAISRFSLRHKEVPVKVQYTPYSLSKGQRSWHAIRIVFDLWVSKVAKGRT
ncbi:MAG: glycosyltransferase family 2 protein [Parcubacteria group bacterium]|nr:glycosyltransferase family 2 protein [Parcubacteria group bacterium]